VSEEKVVAALALLSVYEPEDVAKMLGLSEDEVLRLVFPVLLGMYRFLNSKGAVVVTRKDGNPVIRFVYKNFASELQPSVFARATSSAQGTSVEEKIGELMRSYDALRDALERISERLEMMGVQPPPQPVTVKRVVEEYSVPSAPPTSAGDLPDFVKGNPWLDVLSKRRGGGK